MPIYNGEPTVREAIESVLAQTFTNWELIVSDNASTDRSAEICREYAERDSRIRFVQNETNIGASNNYNVTFNLARGRYFNWFPCDDVMLPGFLEKCVEALDANPDYVMAYTRGMRIDKDGEPYYDYAKILEPTPWPTKAKDRYRRLIRQLLSTGSSVAIPLYVFGVMRREVLAKTHLVRHYLGQDDNLVAEIVLAGQVYEVPESLKYIRYHPGAFSWGPTFTSAHVQQWYRPGEKGKLKRFLRRSWRHRLEFFRVVLGADLSLADKAALTLENVRALLYSVKLKFERRRRPSQRPRKPWLPT
jgi:glycosyltransferase involved in cell wall biosynthesis